MRRPASLAGLFTILVGNTTGGFAGGLAGGLAGAAATVFFAFLKISRFQSHNMLHVGVLSNKSALDAPLRWVYCIDYFYDRQSACRSLAGAASTQKASGNRWLVVRKL